MKRLKCLAVCIAGMVAPIASAASTQPLDDTFDSAYDTIMWTNHANARYPATIDHAVELYQRLADRFPNDPHVWKATLAVADLWDADRRPDSYGKAAAAYAKLESMADPSNADGRTVCDRIMQFDVFYGDKWHPERLTRTKQLADKYEAWATRQDSRIPLLHIWSIKGSILTDLGSNREAITYLVTSLNTAESWGATGYYTKLWASDKATFLAVSAARQDLLNSLLNAIALSNDSDVDAQVAKAPAVASYPLVRSALEHWRSFRDQGTGGDSSDRGDAGDPASSVRAPTTVSDK